MPRKLEPNEQMDKWNLYVRKGDKLKFQIALLDAGHPNAQAAAIRVMMHLYTSDPNIRDAVNERIEDFRVYKQSGKPSKL